MPPTVAGGRGTWPSPLLGAGQEWWGLVDHIMDVAERFARQGFVALAPDLYHGRKTAEPNQAEKLMMALKMDEAARDLGGAVDFLRAHQAVAPKGVGCVGYCMGGGLSLTLATVRPVDACVVYYGVLMGQPDLSKVSGPVLGHFADHDEWASPEVVGALEQQLRGLGKQVEFHTYPGTEHAFFNDTRPESYNAGAAQRSWQRTLEFFRRHLS